MSRSTAAVESELHSSVAALLAGSGQRYTGGRKRLVEILAAADGPLTMYDIMSEVPDMPQSSAYRHLTVLSSYGVVHRLPGTDESGFFELTDELSGRHHHHLTCTNCGTVVDVESSPKLERALEQAADAAADATGFVVDSHRIDLVGLCTNCQ